MQSSARPNAADVSVSVGLHGWDGEDLLSAGAIPWLNLKEDANKILQERPIVSANQSHDDNIVHSRT